MIDNYCHIIKIIGWYRVKPDIIRIFSLKIIIVNTEIQKFPSRGGLPTGNRLRPGLGGEREQPPAVLCEGDKIRNFGFVFDVILVPHL